VDLRGKTLGIVEEALCGYSAHWFEWIRAVKLINEAQGVRVRIAANKKMDSGAAQALGAEPVIERNSWDDSLNRQPALIRHAQVMIHNLRVYRGCATALKKWGPIDCLQLPVVKIHHLIGCLALTRRYGGRRFKRLVMQVNMPPGRHIVGQVEPVFSRNSKLIQSVLRAYRPYVDRGIVCLGSDSDQTAKDYELLTGVPFVEFPTPRISTNTATPPQVRRKNSPVVFTCLGPSRQEKGSDLLLSAIQAYLQMPQRTPARFVLQWTSDLTDASGKTVSPDPWLLEHPDVRLLRRALTSEEYDRELLGSDCVVMPYRWNSYFCRISGLAVEAATAGIPVIYTENTWLERAMKRYGAGLAVRDGDVPDLVETLAAMAKGIDEFQIAARSRAPLAREVNSPENFLRCLWGSMASV
jgi:glycosyltransferase involved in cell wall biosynthesis